jgi:hypothetical protein
MSRQSMRGAMGGGSARWAAAAPITRRQHAGIDGKRQRDRGGGEAAGSAMGSVTWGVGVCTLPTVHPRYPAHQHGAARCEDDAVPQPLLLLDAVPQEVLKVVLLLRVHCGGSAG